MAKILQIAVENKVAAYQSEDVIVCGNSDYQIRFAFDSEWDAHNAKTARFEWGGNYHDVEFTGDTCDVPVIKNTDKVIVGVYVGEEPDGDPILSTTRVVIPCDRSIRCGNTTAGNGTGENYTNQARGYAANAAKSAEAAAASAEEAKEAAEGVGGLTEVGTFTYNNCFLGTMDYDAFGDIGNYININDSYWKHGSQGDMGFPDYIAVNVAKNSKFVKVRVAPVYSSEAYSTPITGIGVSFGYDKTTLMDGYINVDNYTGFTACDDFWNFIEEKSAMWFDGFNITFTFYA